MTLVDELRGVDVHDAHDCYMSAPLFTRSADRIEKLEAALREIADHSPVVTHGWAEHVRHIARTTLSP